MNAKSCEKTKFTQFFVFFSYNLNEKKVAKFSRNDFPISLKTLDKDNIFFNESLVVYLTKDITDSVN